MARRHRPCRLFVGLLLFLACSDHFSLVHGARTMRVVPDASTAEDEDDGNQPVADRNEQSNVDLDRDARGTTDVDGGGTPGANTKARPDDKDSGDEAGDVDGMPAVQTEEARFHTAAQRVYPAIGDSLSKLGFMFKSNPDSAQERVDDKGSGDDDQQSLNLKDFPNCQDYDEHVGRMSRRLAYRIKGLMTSEVNDGRGKICKDRFAEMLMCASNELLWGLEHMHNGTSLQIKLPARLQDSNLKCHQKSSNELGSTRIHRGVQWAVLKAQQSLKDGELKVMGWDRLSSFGSKDSGQYLSLINEHAGLLSGLSKEVQAFVNAASKIFRIIEKPQKYGPILFALFGDEIDTRSLEFLFEIKPEEAHYVMVRLHKAQIEKVGHTTEGISLDFIRDQTDALTEMDKTVRNGIREAARQLQVPCNIIGEGLLGKLTNKLSMPKSSARMVLSIIRKQALTLTALNQLRSEVPEIQQQLQITTGMTDEELGRALNILFNIVGDHGSITLEKLRALKSGGKEAFEKILSTSMGTLRSEVLAIIRSRIAETVSDEVSEEQKVAVHVAVKLSTIVAHPDLYSGLLMGAMNGQLDAESLQFFFDEIDTVTAEQIIEKAKALHPAGHSKFSLACTFKDVSQVIHDSEELPGLKKSVVDLFLKPFTDVEDKVLEVLQQTLHLGASDIKTMLSILYQQRIDKGQFSSLVHQVPRFKNDLPGRDKDRAVDLIFDVMKTDNYITLADLEHFINGTKAEVKTQLERRFRRYFKDLTEEFVDQAQTDRSNGEVDWASLQEDEVDVEDSYGPRTKQGRYVVDSLKGQLAHYGLKELPMEKEILDTYTETGAITSDVMNDMVDRLEEPLDKVFQQADGLIIVMASFVTDFKPQLMNIVEDVITKRLVGTIQQHLPAVRDKLGDITQDIEKWLGKYGIKAPSNMKDELEKGTTGGKGKDFVDMVDKLCAEFIQNSNTFTRTASVALVLTGYMRTVRVLVFDYVRSAATKMVQTVLQDNMPNLGVNIDQLANVKDLVVAVDSLKDFRKNMAKEVDSYMRTLISINDEEQDLAARDDPVTEYSKFIFIGLLYFIFFFFMVYQELTSHGGVTSWINKFLGVDSTSSTNSTSSNNSTNSSHWFAHSTQHLLERAHQSGPTGYTGLDIGLLHLKDDMQLLLGIDASVAAEGKSISTDFEEGIKTLKLGWYEQLLIGGMSLIYVIYLGCMIYVWQRYGSEAMSVSSSSLSAKGVTKRDSFTFLKFTGRADFFGMIPLYLAIMFVLWRIPVVVIANAKMQIGDDDIDPEKIRLDLVILDIMVMLNVYEYAFKGMLNFFRVETPQHIIEIHNKYDSKHPDLTTEKERTWLTKPFASGITQMTSLSQQKNKHFKRSVRKTVLKVRAKLKFPRKAQEAERDSWYAKKIAEEEQKHKFECTTEASDDIALALWNKHENIVAFQDWIVANTKQAMCINSYHFSHYNFVINMIEQTEIVFHKILSTMSFVTIERLNEESKREKASLDSRNEESKREMEALNSTVQVLAQRQAAFDRAHLIQSESGNDMVVPQSASGPISSPEHAYTPTVSLDTVLAAENPKILSLLSPKSTAETETTYPAADQSQVLQSIHALQHEVRDLKAALLRDKTSMPENAGRTEPKDQENEQGVMTELPPAAMAAGGTGSARLETPSSALDLRVPESIA